ncbi:MAG: HypC/HybG/HupF family hydrogenase formation chaperone [Phycisphaerae bacterium]|nr:HypC/HybG/HupF family hydrogenase formation chaperone [Phycisphaerae bacterium]
MCLAVPGQIVELRENEAVVDFQGNRIEISTVLTPDVRQGDWVLVHAGFALTSVSEDEARETWSYLEELKIPEHPTDG